MLYDRVMRNIQNRYKRIKYMDSFINTSHQRKLRKFLENPLSGSQVSGLGSHLYDPGSQIPSPTYELGPGSQVSSPTFWILGLRSQVPPMRWVPGLRSQVSGPTKSPGSQVPLFGYAMNFCRTSSKFLLASRKHFQEKYSLCINKNLWKICCFNRLEPLQKEYF